jgi:hypothetical protein
MASSINGLSYREVTFDAAGTLTADDGLVAAVAAGGIDDVFLFSHGWNNSATTARDLYNRMFTLLATTLGGHVGSSAAVGLFWPSLLFPEDDPNAAPTPAAVGQQGSALAASLAPAFPDQSDNLTKIGDLLDKQPQDPKALETFHQLAAGLVTTPNPGGPEDAGEAAAIKAPTAAVFGAYSAMAKQPTSAAEGLGNPFHALWTGARETLRTLSYYEMKNRAGVVGEKGLGPLIGRLTPPAGKSVRVHLMGHSFGARVVSFSLRGLPASMTGAASPVKSLVLVQGAFSHFAFAKPMPIDHSRNGALADVGVRVDGPLLATFSAADRAVGWWYPTASMLKHEDSESVTDLNYRWGGMGHDGYQQDGVTELKLAASGTPYSFAKGSFYRLDSNAIIAANQSPFSGAHSDIVHPEVVWATVSAAGLA